MIGCGKISFHIGQLPLAEKNDVRWRSRLVFRRSIQLCTSQYLHQENKKRNQTSMVGSSNLMQSKSKPSSDEETDPEVGRVATVRSQTMSRKRQRQIERNRKASKKPATTTNSLSHQKHEMARSRLDFKRRLLRFNVVKLA